MAQVNLEIVVLAVFLVPVRHVVSQRLQAVRQVNIDHQHVVRMGQIGWREVPHRADAAGVELVQRFLRDASGQCQHRNIRHIFLQEVRHFLHAVHGNIAHRHTDFLRVVVKHRQRPEALALERRIFRNRAADIARAHDNLRMFTVKSQNFANVHFQIRHLIPVPLTSEAAEAVDVLPNLRRREVHPLAQLLRRNLLHTCAFQFPQMPIISRQPTDYRVRHMPCHPHSPPVHLLSWGISAQYLHVKGISI